jgi:hypothetical protein
MLALLLAFAIYTALGASNPSAPQCAIKAQPHIALPPLMTAVTVVTVEPQATPETLWRKAELCLFEGELRVRCSVLWEGDSAAKAPRTSRVEWKSLGLSGGEYEVVLQVQSLAGVCRAVDKLIVQGEQ